jgi:hypothetical protein
VSARRRRIARARRAGRAVYRPAPVRLLAPGKPVGAWRIRAYSSARHGLLETVERSYAVVDAGGVVVDVALVIQRALPVLGEIAAWKELAPGWLVPGVLLASAHAVAQGWRVVAAPRTGRLIVRAPASVRHERSVGGPFDRSFVAETGDRAWVSIERASDHELASAMRGAYGQGAEEATAAAKAWRGRYPERITGTGWKGWARDADAMTRSRGAIGAVTNQYHHAVY